MDVTVRTDPVNPDQLPAGTIEFLDLREDAPTDAPEYVSQIAQAAAKMREKIIQNFPAAVEDLTRRGLIGAQQAQVAIQQSKDRRVRKVLRQVAVMGNVGPVMGQTFAPPGHSEQIILEDMYTTLDFIEPYFNFDFYESAFFKEDHITGAIIDLTSTGVVKRGIAVMPFEDDGTEEDQGTTEIDDDQATRDGVDEEKDAGDAEAQALEAWLDAINPIDDFPSIVENLDASFSVTANSFLEVIGDSFAPERKPVKLKRAISSQMRVLRMHRGYVQYVLGKWAWFNVYMPRLEDRQAGAQAWADYWAGKGIDTADPEFLASPWSRMLSSAMPEGVWNPYLTEMVHLKDTAIDSHYYGMPKTYRLAKLHLLLQSAMDYNIALQQNNQVQPFVAVYHGELDESSRKDLKAFLRQDRGAKAFGSVPLLTTYTDVDGGKGGLEIVPVNPGGPTTLFLDLWSRCIKDYAMAWHTPLDLLTTENSNRATIEIAEQMWNDNVVSKRQAIYERMLERLTRVDMGFERRRIGFTRLDKDDQLANAQIAKLYHGMGALNPDEVRHDYLNKGPRPGGDIYALGETKPVIEDEPAEIQSGAKAEELAQLSPKDLQALFDQAQAVQKKQAATNAATGQPPPGQAAA